jgi:hypothetical protein
MTAGELCEEIELELELIATAVREALALYGELGESEPSIREKTAAAAFMAQFYGGIENILKRIHRYFGVTPPSGDTWHLEIFRRFCSPGVSPLPFLFDDALARDLAPFRKFRHVVYHSYGFQLEWERMRDGLASLESVHHRLISSLDSFLVSLP